LKTNLRARGKVGEAHALAALERRGYRIVDTNIHLGARSGLIGELDIVAWDGATLAFIEVKARRGRLSIPTEAVTPAKQRQIAQLALAYAAQHGLLEAEDIPFRFDVVAVWLSGADDEVARVEILAGAFLAEEGD
jgi:putative endonuclease